MGTMMIGFKLKDPKMAAGLKEGDNVRFKATKQGDDSIITRIEKA